MTHHRLCERLCAACGHHHAHDYKDGVCLSGDRVPIGADGARCEIDVAINSCPCPHPHGVDEHPPGEA